MKKYIITILIAIVVGAVLGIYSFNKFKEEDIRPVFNITKNQAYAIQIGVFDTYENASKLAEKYGGLVILDNEKYRVYISIVNDTLNLMKSYYDQKGIAYYIRTIDVSQEFIDKLNNYETVLKVIDKEEYDSIIKNILKDYKELNNE